jgi:hypothetical protein
MSIFYLFMIFIVIAFVLSLLRNGGRVGDNRRVDRGQPHTPMDDTTHTAMNDMNFNGIPDYMEPHNVDTDHDGIPDYMDQNPFGFDNHVSGGISDNDSFGSSNNFDAGDFGGGFQEGSSDMGSDSMNGL